MVTLTSRIIAMRVRNSSYKHIALNSADIASLSIHPPILPTLFIWFINSPSSDVT